MSREFEIRLSGSGGQGLILAGRILSAALAAEGWNVSQSQSYEPTSRGGLSRSDLVVSDGEVDFPLVTALDYLLVMDQVAAPASTHLLKPRTVVVVDSGRVESPPRGAFTTRPFPLTEVARKVGSGRVANIVALGAMSGAGSPWKRESVAQAVADMAPDGFRDLNLNAFAEGLRLGEGTAAGQDRRSPAALTSGTGR
jgi:2-oxoglutarate ferredoxin oxidoreductase subunit gamma